MSNKKRSRTAKIREPLKPGTDPSRFAVAAIWLRAALIALSGLLVYSNSLAGPFILDDELSIVSSPYIRRLWPLSRVLFPERESPVAGRPIVNVSFAINYLVGGLNVRGYHLANILIHIICALLLFGIVRRTLTLPALRSFARRSTDLAFASAVLWVVHPLNSEAVDYITERTESLMGLFFLLTLYAAIRALNSPRPAAWQATAVISCAFGMGCKESMVTAPLIIALFDRAYVFDSFKEAFHSRWRLYAALALTWGVLAALIWSGPRVHSAGFGTGVSPWTYLLNQTGIILQYLRLSIGPRPLVLDYGKPLPLTLAQVLPQAAVVFALAVVVIVALAYRPKPGFLGAWFFITLAPTSSIVPIATEVGTERRMYLPLMAIIVGIVIAASVLWNMVRARIELRRAKPLIGVKFAGAAVLLLTVVLLGTETFARNREYRSALTLARTVLDRRPHARAHLWVGTELLAAGRRGESIAELRIAIPGEPRARYVLGRLLVEDRQYDEAIHQLEEFIREQPLLLEVLDARNTIGRALVLQGKTAEAADQFRQVLKMVPSNADAHMLLADVLMKQERYDEAVSQYREYLRLRPSDPSAMGNLGIALAAAERVDEAVSVFRRAADLRPQDFMAHRNLANALLSARDFDGALEHAQAAVNLKPDDAVAHDVLGLAFVGKDRFDAAVAHFEQAVHLDPSYQEARENLALARRLAK